MSPEQVIEFIRSRGGRLWIEGDLLIVEPDSAGLPIIDQLRAAKPQIVALIQNGQGVSDETDSDTLPGQWLLDRCVSRDRCFGGIAALHLDLARWCAEHGLPVPASRRAFVEALEAEGFTVSTDGMVAGLVLKADLWALVAPEASAEPEQATAGKRRTGRRCA